MSPNVTPPLKRVRRACVLAILIAMPAVARAQSAADSMAPEIDLPTLAGGRVKLSDFRGHPVVVTFWGTWCPPCREEFPQLVAAYGRYRVAGLVIVAVNQRDQELSTKAVQEFVTEFGVTFTVALDVRGRSRRAFLLVGLPTTVFIDTAGVLRVIHPGPLSQSDLDKGLAIILPRASRLGQSGDLRGIGGTM